VAKSADGKAGHRAKRGRPPSGQEPGERVVDYPQLSMRVPSLAKQRLEALARVTRQPQWRVLAAAVDAYIQSRPVDEQKLVKGLLTRAGRLLTQPARRSTPIASPAVILVVDDNEAMLFARCTLLRAEGFEVIEAPTGREALAALARRRPDLVMLDVHLPDINGLDICRQIKGDPALAGIKVIQVSSTYTTPHDQLHGLETGGADIYLTEPVPRGTLLSVVERLLAS
jgi:CheY-like chemotaxis protein